MKALYVEDGHENVIRTEEDLSLYRAPRRMPGGQKFIAGKDLFIHKGRTGKEVYYMLQWFLKPEKREEIVQISPGMAEKFLSQRGIVCNTTGEADQKALGTMQQYGWGMPEEF